MKIYFTNRPGFHKFIYGGHPSSIILVKNPCRRKLTPDELGQLIGYDPAVKMHDFCEMVSLDFFLRNSDIVTLHMPLRGENYHIIGANEIAKMKDGAARFDIEKEAMDNLLEGLRIKGVLFP